MNCGVLLSYICCNGGNEKKENSEQVFGTSESKSIKLNSILDSRNSSKGYLKDSLQRSSQSKPRQSITIHSSGSNEEQKVIVDSTDGKIIKVTLIQSSLEKNLSAAIQVRS